MVQNKETEMNLEQLKTEISESLARRYAEGSCSVTGKWGLFELLLDAREAALKRAARYRYQLEPEFTRNADDQYHVDSLLRFHDQAFVWNAYLAILKREPDETGLDGHLQNLRSGRIDKIGTLARLRFSSEGKAVGVRIDGLLAPAIISRLSRIPILGYVLATFTHLASLPKLVRNQGQFECYMVAQHVRLLEYINEFNASVVTIDQSQQERELMRRLDRLRDEIDLLVAAQDKADQKSANPDHREYSSEK